MEIDFRCAFVTSSCRNLSSMENQVTQHSASDIGKTVLSLGAILAVILTFWQITSSVRADIRPELQELRMDMRKIEEKVNTLIGQQDVILRKLELTKK